jgi:hypothetical protein
MIAIAIWILDEIFLMFIFGRIKYCVIHNACMNGTLVKGEDFFLIDGLLQIFHHSVRNFLLFLFHTKYDTGIFRSGIIIRASEGFPIVKTY